MLDIPQIMTWSREHQHWAPDRILLGSNSIPKEYKALVALQVAHAKAIKKKLPSWSMAQTYLPSALNLEQCSSEITANYKQRFVKTSDTIIDLSGGLGVDFAALVAQSKKGIYVEESPVLVEASLYNLPRVLPDAHIDIICGNSMDLLPKLIEQHTPTLLFVDPARREKQVRDKRVYAIEDCTPNVLELIDNLPKLCARYQSPNPSILLKLSPMLDLIHTLRLIPSTSELHIISVRGEVKELLLYIHPTLSYLSPEDIPIHIVELREGQAPQEFCWSQGIRQELHANISIANSVKRYIYEPSAVMMKSGFFKSIAKRYDLEALHPDSHLYTGNNFVADFIGRKFICEETIPFKASQLKQIGKRIQSAQISCRNFPLTPEQLRKRLGVTENSLRTILATKLWNGNQVLLNCYLCNHDE